MQTFIRLITVLFLAIGALPLWGDAMDTLETTIQRSRDQSVLTQQLLAEYSLIKLEIKYQNPQQKFSANIKRFNKNIESLDAFAASKKAFKNIERISSIWGKVKPVLLSQEGDDMELFYAMDTLLGYSRKTTVMYTRQTGATLGLIINNAGEVGINVQRLVSLYLFKVRGIENEELETIRVETMNAFHAAIKELQEVPVNTEETKDLLKNIQKAFMYFTVMGKAKKRYIPTLIYQKSMGILEDANKLSKLYNSIITLN
jgi:hypothetical protein